MTKIAFDILCILLAVPVALFTISVAIPFLLGCFAIGFIMGFNKYFKKKFLC